LPGAVFFPAVAGCSSSRATERHAGTESFAGAFSASATAAQTHRRDRRQQPDRARTGPRGSPKLCRIGSDVNLTYRRVSVGFRHRAPALSIGPQKREVRCAARHEAEEHTNSARLAMPCDFHRLFTPSLSRCMDDVSRRLVSPIPIASPPVFLRSVSPMVCPYPVRDEAANPPFRHSILPRRLYARPFGLQPRCLQECDRLLSERRISIEDGISILTRFRECIARLLDDPFRRRVVSHIETQNPAS